MLRATIGAQALIQGGIYLADWKNATVWIWVAGLLAIISGASLLMGFLTPLAGTVLCLSNIIIFLSPSSVILNPGDSTLSVIYVFMMAVAISLLGPGAFSLDARLFGRREIIIPDD